MQGKMERWRYLCELAAVEQDSQKLLLLVKEINGLLEEKRRRLTMIKFVPSHSPHGKVLVN